MWIRTGVLIVVVIAIGLIAIWFVGKSPRTDPHWIVRH